MINRVKILCVILLISTLQTGCERDEICLEEITPKLIIRFYNDSNHNEVRNVLNLKVHIEGIDGDYEHETITAVTDSVAIPLLVTQNKTSLVLSIQEDNEPGTEVNSDTITLVYNQEDLFVSRSCGFKTVYHEVLVSVKDDDDNWIKSLDTKDDPQEIIDEKAAHVKIYH